MTLEAQLTVPLNTVDFDKAFCEIASLTSAYVSSQSPQNPVVVLTSSVTQASIVVPAEMTNGHLSFALLELVQQFQATSLFIAFGLSDLESTDQAFLHSAFGDAELLAVVYGRCALTDRAVIILRDYFSKVVFQTELSADFQVQLPFLEKLWPVVQRYFQS